MRVRTLFLSILLSLVGVSSWGQTPEDSVAIVESRWESRTVEHGVIAAQSRFEKLYGEPQDVFVIEITQKKHAFEVLDHHGRAFTSFNASARGASAAINGTFFDMGKSERSVCFVAHKGKVVEYTHKSMGQLSNGAVIMDGEKVEIVPWNVKDERNLYPDSIATVALADKDVMVCGPLMIQNGKELKFYSESHVLGRHPRSAIAVRDGSVFFVVVDGRSKRSKGVTIPEFAHLLRVMGMEEALNLDGGGSSVLWARPKVQYYTDGTPVCPCTGIMNEPSDGGGKERAVSNSIIVTSTR